MTTHTNTDYPAEQQPDGGARDDAYWAALADAAEQDLDQVVPFQTDPAHRHEGPAARQYVADMLAGTDYTPMPGPGRPARGQEREASVTRSFRLPASLDARLEQYVTQHGTKASWVLRAALEQYLPPTQR